MIVSVSQPVLEVRICLSDSSRPREGTHSWCCFCFLDFLLVVDLADLDTVALVESNLEIAFNKWSWEDNCSDLDLKVFEFDLMESDSEVEQESWWGEWGEECKADAIEDVVRVKISDDGDVSVIDLHLEGLETSTWAGVHVREEETNERVVNDDVGEVIDREGREGINEGDWWEGIVGDGEVNKAEVDDEGEVNVLKVSDGEENKVGDKDQWKKIRYHLTCCDISVPSMIRSKLDMHWIHVM